MNTAYETAFQRQANPNPTIIACKLDGIHPLGTFAGTIYKIGYFMNGKFVPSDTADQLATAPSPQRTSARPVHSEIPDALEGSH